MKPLWSPSNSADLGVINYYPHPPTYLPLEVARRAYTPFSMVHYSWLFYTKRCHVSYFFMISYFLMIKMSISCKIFHTSLQYPYVCIRVSIVCLFN